MNAVLEAPTQITCLPGQAHHWLIGEPHHHYEDAELIETTNQVCRKCGTLRVGSVLIPPEIDNDGNRDQW